MSINLQQRPPIDPRDSSFDAPMFDRLNYFFGQLLSANDFRAEQQYFREKIKLHNRYLHGHGIACGLCVRPPRYDTEYPSRHEQELADVEAARDEANKWLADAQQAGDLASAANLEAQINELTRAIDTMDQALADADGV